tara:strand:- start:77 stop:268 length:192 start_codon:yes stop_codon:yes gene_type:complete
MGNSSVAVVRVVGTHKIFMRFGVKGIFFNKGSIAVIVTVWLHIHGYKLIIKISHVGLGLEVKA